MHIPVLLNEVVSFFKDVKGTILDCTCGLGGHTKAILEVNSNVKIVCNDRDSEALVLAKKNLEKFKNRVIFSNKPFSIVSKEFVVDGVLADLGISSLQIDKKERGFSFNSEFLDMRMDKREKFSAIDVLAYSKEELERVFFNGGIKNYKKLALVLANKGIKTTKELNKTIFKFFPNATKNFLSVVYQAIRIEVNKELDELKTLLENVEKNRKSKEIVAIISFHSIEDRLVKNYFKKWARNCICPKDAIICKCGNNNSKGNTADQTGILSTTAFS